MNNKFYIKKIDDYYIVKDGEYTWHFDTLEDAKQYFGLSGMFKIKYKELKDKKKKGIK